jgi:hypothetical protein
MSLLNANNLGVYVLKSHEYSSTTPYKIFDNSSYSNAVSEAQADASASLNDIIMMVNGSDMHSVGTDPAIFRYNNIESDPANDPHGVVNANSLITLAYAATNSTLDLSNATDEVVAKTTQCNSATYTSIGAQSWSIQADGLISSEDRDTGSYDSYGTDIFDMCNYGYYVIVKYTLDIDNDEATGTDDQNITYIGQGIVENANITGTFDSTSTYSATIRGYGKLYKFNN